MERDVYLKTKKALHRMSDTLKRPPQRHSLHSRGCAHFLSIVELLLTQKTELPCLKRVCLRNFNVPLNKKCWESFFIGNNSVSYYYYYYYRGGPP